jgi:hypothetical protein
MHEVLRFALSFNLVISIIDINDSLFNIKVYFC